MMRTNKIVFLLIIFSVNFLKINSIAQATGPYVSILLERHFDQRGHQMAIVFGDNKINRISNSNFLFPPSQSAELGLFETPTNIDLLNFRSVLAKIKRRKSIFFDAKTAANIDPHGLWIIIDGYRLSPLAAEFEEVKSHFFKIAEKKIWQPVDSVLMTQNKFGDIKVEYKGSKSKKLYSEKCSETSSKQTLCELREFGYAYFTK